MRDFVELGLQAGRVSDGFTNVSDILRRLGVIAPNGALTNAAAVAFYKAPSAYPEMKLGLLAGNDKLDIFDLQQEGLPLIQLFKRAEFFAVSNIRRRFVFGEPGMQRREIPEIPREAVREAVANALCHRDYTTGTAVEVNVYMDFVEAASLGLFPEGDAPENHLAGSDGDLKQRSPGIAQALFRSGMIEQYGTGIPRIKRYCDAEGVKFSYRQTANTTVIRFDRPSAQVIEELPSGAESTGRPQERQGDEKGDHGRGRRWKDEGNGNPKNARQHWSARMGRRKHERPAPALPPCRHQLNRYCPPVSEPAGSSDTPNISPTAQRVVDLAAKADIEDVMLCDLPGVLSFLGLPPETEMPPGNKGKAKLKKPCRKVAPNKAYHSGERAKDLTSHLDMAEIRASAPVPLGEIDGAVVSG